MFAQIKNKHLTLLLLVAITSSCGETKTENVNPKEVKQTQAKEKEIVKIPIGDKILGQWSFTESENEEWFSASIFPAKKFEEIAILDSTISFEKVSFPYKRSNDTTLKIQFYENFNANLYVKFHSDTMVLYTKHYKALTTKSGAVKFIKN